VSRRRAPARLTLPASRARARAQALDMDHTRGAIGGTMDRFKRVLENKGNRSLMYVVGGVFGIFALVKIMA
jgi:hypothetical protein